MNLLWIDIDKQLNCVAFIICSYALYIFDLDVDAQDEFVADAEALESIVQNRSRTTIRLRATSTGAYTSKLLLNSVVHTIHVTCNLIRLFNSTSDAFGVQS